MTLIPKGLLLQYSAAAGELQLCNFAPKIRLGGMAWDSGFG